MTDLNGWRVKPLVWRPNPDDSEGGLLGFGAEHLSIIYHAMKDSWSLHRRMNWGDAPTLEAAKAAAQADYEARIMSALEVTEDDVREAAMGIRALDEDDDEVIIKRSAYLRLRAALAKLQDATD